jgi:hypothetical protein
LVSSVDHHIRYAFLGLIDGSRHRAADSKRQPLPHESQ